MEFERQLQDKNRYILYIQGIDGVTAANIHEKVTSFFQEKLLIKEEIAINKAFKQKDDSTWITVHLKNPKDKGKIYGNIKKPEGSTEQTK